MELIKPDNSPHVAVLVIHSWWGLTDSFRSYGSALADAGYLVGLADLFDGKTAETETEAKALRAASRPIPMYRSLGADIASLRTALGTNSGRVGVVGFSMGGHWAVWLTQRPAYGIATTILYYAARAGDFSACRSGIIAHFADEDLWVKRSARKTMERAIDKSKCTYRAYDYPQTQHWFAESARPLEFDMDAALLALDRDIIHLAQNLVG